MGANPGGEGVWASVPPHKAIASRPRWHPAGHKMAKNAGAGERSW